MKFTRRNFLKSIVTVLGVAAVEQAIPRQSPIRVNPTDEWEEWSNTTHDLPVQAEQVQAFGDFHFRTAAVGDWYVADSLIWVMGEDGWLIVRPEA